MAQKRPFDDEVVDEVSSKHQRQHGPGDEIISCDDGFSNGVSEKPYDSGEASIGKGELDFREEHENGSCPEILREAVEEIGSDMPRSASFSHWATSSSSDEDEPSEDMVHLPFLSGYFSFDPSVRSAVNPDDVYYCFLDSPRKRVPVGPDHQADIPCWGTQEIENTSDAASDRNYVVNDGGELVGICIMPNPEIEPPTYEGDKVGDGRCECRCPDQGTIRCVRQHIAEARDNLKRTLGEDTFVELGFYDVGEVVAEKWSEEEEELFHEVVYSNPASLGKNFWNVLSVVFPSRTKMEIVSYYFNVFMLQKRAEQNRCDRMNIDSDNDEWQGSDDDGGDEGGVSDEDEDSGVESPAHHDSLEFHQNGLLAHKHEHEDDGGLSDDAQATDNDNSGGGLVRKSDLDLGFELPGKKSDDDGGENDGQDGSCTSSDSGLPVQGAQLKPDGSQEWNEYILESSDAKVWDVYSMSCPKNNVDFLPTCSMIEEVFGDGDF